LTNRDKGDNFERMKEIAEVAVGLPVSKTFHYLIPERMRESIQVGMRVLVPFKGRKVTGFTIELVDRPPEGLEERPGNRKPPGRSPLIDPQSPPPPISDYHLSPWRSDQNRLPGLHLKSELVLS
jgi:hypothetical protein